MPIAGVLKDRAIETVGGIKEFHRQSERYSKDLLFFEKYKSKLTKTHDKKWVAVFNDEIVGYDKKLPKLIIALKRKGIPEDSALIQFISSEKLLTLFTR